MKKLLLLFVLMFGVALMSEASSGGPEIDEGKIMHCRCKQDGCYAGNWISFRPECATNEGPIQCNQYASNCAK